MLPIHVHYLYDTDKIQPCGSCLCWMNKKLPRTRPGRVLDRLRSFPNGSASHIQVHVWHGMCLGRVHTNLNWLFLIVPQNAIALSLGNVCVFDVFCGEHQEWKQRCILRCYTRDSFSRCNWPDFLSNCSICWLGRALQVYVMFSMRTIFWRGGKESMRCRLIFWCLFPVSCCCHHLQAVLRELPGSSTSSLAWSL